MYSKSLSYFSYLRPNEDRQEEALWRACSEVVWRCGGGYNNQPEVKVTVGLPTSQVYVQHSSTYYQDGITEMVSLYYNLLKKTHRKLIVA